MFRRQSKYRNSKVSVSGIRFDSKKEAKRYQELSLLLKAGKIKDLVLQPKFLLQESFTYNGKKERPIYYIADFQYMEVSTGKIVVEDVKGIKTDVYKLKRKLFLFIYHDVDFRET